MKLRAMIARFEDTRDLRLMGGYRERHRSRARPGHRAGAAALRDDAAGPGRPACADVFQEIARALAPEPAGDAAASNAQPAQR